MVANLIFWFCLHLVTEKRFKQTQCVRYSKKIHLGLFHNLTSGERSHYMLANLLCWVFVLLVIEEWLKQPHCVSYFKMIIFCCFVIWPVYKAKLCGILFTVSIVGTLGHWQKCIIRKPVLAVSLRFSIFV